MNLRRALVTIAVVAMFTGCVSVKDRSEKYRAYIGKQFVTRFDFALWKLKLHQYDIVPYRLESVGMTDTDRFGTKIAVIPAGTVVTVRDAKVSFTGGDWDFIIAELRVPETNEVVAFEEMLGFSSVDPSEILKRWAPAK